MLPYDDDTSTPGGNLAKPTKGEANYRPPNPGGSVKSCSNCFFYSAGPKRCLLISDENLLIKPDNICAQHLFSPIARRSTAGLPQVQMRSAGELRFMQSGSGGACRSCLYYAPSLVESEEGECVALCEPFSSLARVQSLGFCARFTVRSEAVSSSGDYSDWRQADDSGEW